MNKTKTINLSEFQDLLAGIHGAKAISFSAITDTRPNKTGNPYKAIYKLSRINGMTGANHEASVNRALAKAGETPDFVGSKRTWGKRISSALVEKDGKHYLVIHIQSRRNFYLIPGSSYKQLVPKEQVAQFLPIEKETNVTYRNFKLENITSLSMDKVRYRIRH